MPYSQLVPAHDWYFVHDASVGDSPVVWPIAAFALNDRGEVVGLVGATFGTNKLSVAPPVGGQYLRREQLTEAEVALAKKR